MITIPNQFDEAIPEWDVALEALIREEHHKLGRPLVLADFQRLSRQYAIRYDDMMATLFELLIRDRWAYFDEQGVRAPISREQYEQLRSNGRIEFADVRAFRGDFHALA